LYRSFFKKYYPIENIIFLLEFLYKIFIIKIKVNEVKSKRKKKINKRSDKKKIIVLFLGIVLGKEKEKKN